MDEYACPLPVGTGWFILYSMYVKVDSPNMPVITLNLEFDP